MQVVLPINYFRKTFNEEFAFFKSDAHSLVHGRVTFSNRPIDWYRLSGITVCSAIINTTLGMMASFRVLPLYVSLSVGLVATIVAITAGIKFNAYLTRRSKTKYAQVDTIFDIENFQELVEQINQKLLGLYAERFKYFNKDEAVTFARHSQKVLADELLAGNIGKLDDLLDENKLKKIMFEASKSDPELVLSSQQGKLSYSTGAIIKNTRLGASNVDQVHIASIGDKKTEHQFSLGQLFNRMRNSFFHHAAPVYSDTALSGVNHSIKPL